jgi:ABC-type Fe3+ transport system permease subunit
LKNLLAKRDNIIKNCKEKPDLTNPFNRKLYLECYKADCVNKIETKKIKSLENLEMFKSVIASGQIALRFLLLINGGASLAMLTFIGTLTKNRPVMVTEYAFSLLFFVIGVLLATICAGLTYINQVIYHAKGDKKGNCFRFITLLCGASSAIVFAVGTYFAYQAFKMFASLTPI